MDGIVVGAASMVLMLLSGVSGPLIDTFFLGGKFERRQVVATKAACQIYPVLRPATVNLRVLRSKISKEIR